MFKVVMCAQNMEKDMFTGLTEQEAEKFCIDNNWEFADENEFVRDLYVDEDDEEELEFDGSLDDYPDDYDLEFGFDPYAGCYTYDC